MNCHLSVSMVTQPATQEAHCIFFVVVVVFASLQLWTHGCRFQSTSKWRGLCWCIQGYISPKGSRVFQMCYLTAAFCHRRCRWSQKKCCLCKVHTPARIFLQGVLIGNSVQ